MTTNQISKRTLIGYQVNVCLVFSDGGFVDTSVVHDLRLAVEVDGARL